VVVVVAMAVEQLVGIVAAAAAVEQHSRGSDLV